MSSKLTRANLLRQTAYSRLKEAQEIGIQASTNESYKSQFLARADEIEGAYEDFRSSHNTIIGLISDEEFSEYDKLRIAADQAYYYVKSIKHDLLLKNSAGTSSNTSSKTSLQPCKPSARIPKLSIPTFSGNFRDWPSFFDLFKSIIHENTDLSDVEKFRYLLTSLSHEPLALIKGIPLIDANYKIAYEILEKRYQNKRILASQYYNDIFNAQPVQKPTSVKLRHLLNIFTENVAALRVLDFPVDHWDFLLFNMLMNKLDVKTRTDFELENSVNHEIPTYRQLVTFLERQCTALESVQFTTSNLQYANSGIPQRVSRAPSRGPVASFVASESQPGPSGQSTKCFLCSSSHPLYKCQSFLAKTPQERFSLVKQHNLCVNCLISPHSVRNCSSSHKCRICKLPHHTTLHFDKSSKGSSPSLQPSNQSEPVNSVGETQSIVPTSLVSTNSSTASTLTTILLSTCVIHVKDFNGNFQKIRILLDTGSMANFISDTCVRRLGLPRRRISIPVEGLNGMTSSTTQGTTSCLIKPCDQSGPTFSLEAIIIPKVCSNQPKFHINPRDLTHIHGLKLADPKFYQPGPIDMLIGAELVPFLLRSKRIFGGPNQPVALETIYGYVLQGRTSTSPQKCHLTSLHSSVDLNVDHILRRFWEVENVPQPPCVSPEDEICEKIYSSLTFREPTGRFSVPLPFRIQNPSFCDTYTQAYRRFCMLENRFLKNPNLKGKYVEFMTDYINREHMSPVPTSEFKSPTSYYISHHAIFKEQIENSSVIYKIRVVFDASLRDVQGVSLNDTLYTGPKLQKDISCLLLNFRYFRYCFTCDIKQMYRQINVNKEFWQFQKIIWRSDPSEPLREYYLRTVTYGVSCSPYLALKTLQELAKSEKARFPKAAKALEENFYIDDGLLGSDSVEDTRALQLELINLLREGGFELGKWAGNHPSLIQDFGSDVLTDCTFDKDEPSFIKVLGLKWNPKADVFSYSYYPLNKTCSKRSILSEVSRIFDPLGFVSPCLLLAKQLLQKLWQSHVSWDEELPEHIQRVWQQFKVELPGLGNIKIPRYFGFDRTSEVQIHGFCDASEIGYASVVYLRFWNSNSFKTTLVCAKCRVSPLKTQSIARLELLAALLLANLIAFVIESFKGIFTFNDIYVWSDSMIVLTWVTSSPHRWKTFIANRVRHIQEIISISSWHHVPSHLNPADCASRGLSPAQLSQFSLWWDGPEFLLKSEEHWPTQNNFHSSNGVEIPEERAPTVLLSKLITTENVILCLLSRFSSLPKIQRITAYILRFVSNGLKRNDISMFNLSISPQESDNALKYLIRVVQNDVFAEIRLKIKQNEVLPKPIRKLAPFIDQYGLLRVGGRLQKSPFSFDVKHPLLLPKVHRLTDLIIEWTHQTSLHPGLKTMQYLLLQRFWILSPRSAIYRCLSKCIRCFRCKPKSYNPFMGNLPSVRVTPLRAFTSVCLDFAGPFPLLMSKTRGAKTYKGYVCVFVCCSTRAIHFEVTSDLSSDTFLAAFRRFISRRGQCLSIRSDQGTNFKGAYNEMINLAQVTAETLSITWDFNPPSAPHFNGLAEAAVKSFKTHFYKVIGTQVLSYEEFYTLMTQIEAVLNSRPLCAVSTDPNDLQALTPGHFLVFEPLVSSIPNPDLSSLNINRLNRWQLIQRIQGDFWKRWSREYIHSLQERSKWSTSNPSLNENSLVLIKDDQQPPLRWPLARIMKLHHGDDGVARVVTLKTASGGTMQRPVVKVCPLPVH
ncbi:uncharacterized protein LOC123311742 [Coccinella septempunctata]|uniref:uncharacterized protein LOC123309785 n=1 Tax=Coccinella septempunctata TaxID=41139 RepID=UPI001D0894F1|nr:uncharacterized protein LOC123309785 [Coccinella septempunctata]XP_044749615.1 uncharacterized protein LOC123310230 [Coccinella septempunctata]XP_044751620.1 uncharacterized protein LOC123311626 [Coccinella septempunctata]XP_044751748.1 uncharacterized protein LOC123311742 [Coccinella septempunctata]